MAYERKTRDEWQLCGNYGYGWDVLVTYTGHKEALEDLKIYRENEPFATFYLKRHRVKKEVC